MNKIKVYMITTWGIKCGVADYSNNLYQELNKLDYIEPEIIPIKKTNSLSPFYFFKLLKEIKDPDIIHIQYQYAMFGRIPLLYNINIFKILSSYFSLIIFYLKFWKGYNVITTVHEFSGNSISERVILKFLNMSDYLILHEKKTLEIFKNSGIKQEKLLKIPIGLAEGKLLDKVKSKQKLGISQKRVITIFGFLHENKGHELVIDVLPKLDNDVILLIAGEARVKEHEQYYQFLKDKVNKLGLKGRVKFLNFVDDSDIPIVFSATDLFIFPYRFIYASAALASVISYNIPIITSDIEYFKEFREENDCIEIFDLSDKDDLLEKISGLFNNETRQQYLKERCKQVYTRLNWGKIAEKTCKIYLKMINSGAKK